MALVRRLQKDTYLDQHGACDSNFHLPHNIQLVHPIPIVCVKKSAEPTPPCSYVHPNEKGKCTKPSKAGTNRCGFHKNK